MKPKSLLDILEQLYKLTPEKFARVNWEDLAKSLEMPVAELQAEFTKYRTEAEQTKVKEWRKIFHTGSELAEGDVFVYVDGILPEGITFVGSLPGVGKSWFGLSLAKALTTGEPFMEVFAVKEIVPVIYLVPEMSDRAVRRRIEKLGMPMTEKFYVQTISDGIIKLDDLTLKGAIQELHPVVFLDTAIRFSEAESENSSSDIARSISQGVIRLRNWGARAVVCLHHSPKFSANEDFMSQENVLRGSGDIAAICDCIWGLRHDRRMKGKRQDMEYLIQSREKTRICCVNVKERDFTAAKPFVIQGRPYIDQKGDFAVQTEGVGGPTIEERIMKAIEKDPARSINSIKDEFGVGHEKVVEAARGDHWEQKDGYWVRTIPF